jgi:hypothetical protein
MTGVKIFFWGGVAGRARVMATASPRNPVLNASSCDIARHLLDGCSVKTFRHFLQQTVKLQERVRAG